MGADEAQPDFTQRRQTPGGIGGFAGKRTEAGRRPLLAVLGMAASAAAIWLALGQVSLTSVREALAGADYIWLIPTLVLTYLTGWLRAVRWQKLFMRPDSITTWQSFAALNVGLMFNNVLPARGGEIPRALAARRVSGVSGVEVGMTIVVERLLDVFALAVIGVALWPVVPDRTWIRVLAVVCAALVAVSVTLVAVVLILRRRFPDFLLGLLRRLPFVTDERAHALRVAVGAGSAILLSPRRVTLAVGMSFMIWAAASAAACALFPAFGFEVAPETAVLLLVANSFALTIPSTPGGVGLYEASIQAALVAVGVSASVALSYALVLHAVNMLPVMATGALCTWVLGRQPPHPRFREHPVPEASNGHGH